MTSTIILPGDIFGYLGLFFVILTSMLMFGRRVFLRYAKNLNTLRTIHILVATLAGFFIILHVAYFVTYPITNAVLLGYVSVALAGVVWIAGTAYLEKFREPFYYHGSFSFAAVSMMLIHTVSSGANVPIIISYFVLGVTSVLIIVKAYGHTYRLLTRETVEEIY